jgi:alpha-tubulin suppressor-like RCC1 family protein
VSVRRCLTIAALIAIIVAPASPAAGAVPQTSSSSCHDALGRVIGCPGARPGEVSTAGAPAKVISIWGGARHGIALKSDGTVWDWGINFAGKLGDGTVSVCNGFTNCTNERHTPIEVHGPNDVGYLDSITAVMGGELHNFALKSDGTVWSWGSNMFGQLGDGTYTDRATPVQVTGLVSVTALGGRGYHSLAIGSGGSVWTWGWNRSGELGVSTAITESAVPTQVIGLSGVLTVTGGYDFSLALMPDHTLRAWGDDSDGELGDGTKTNTSVPVAVQGLTNVAQVSAGWKHVVALKSDGTVWTWGQNVNGELGNGVTSTVGISVPIQVGGLSGIIAVSGGDCHTTALKADGTVWAWGCNNPHTNGVGNYELGDETAIERYTPVQVHGLTNVVAIAARDYHNYAIEADGSVWAWGFNANGQLGDNTTTDRDLAVRVLFPSAPFTPTAWIYLPLVLR